MGALIDVSQYMPHGMCLLWQPWLVALWAGSDALIFLSYSLIPFALFQVLRQRSEVPHRGLVVLFASFILLCGLTHLFGIVTLWHPIYPYVGVLKLATGVVSMATALILFRLVPTLVAFPTPSALTAANERLTQEIHSHRSTLEDLRKAKDGLQAEVDRRTAELKQANAMLAVRTREAVHRSNNLLAVVGSLAKQSARDKPNTDDFLDAFVGRIDALASATASVMKSENHTTQDLETIVRGQLQPLLEQSAGSVAIEGPSIRIGSEAAQQLSLAVHELSTNAQKYSALEMTDTSIAIGWSVQQAKNGEEMLEFSWDEQLASTEQADGDREKRVGFGTQLLTRVVPAMLRAKADRSLRDGRLVYRLRIPMSALVADTEIHEADNLAARIVDESFGIA